MPSYKNIFAGLVALEDSNLTHSQRNRCIALFALQDNPFGMLSQSLYSRALERQNSQKQTIVEQRGEIDHITSLKEFLLDEHCKMKGLIHQKQLETSRLEQLLNDEFEELHDDLVIEDVGANLVDQLNESEKLNKILLQTLEQAMFEIQRLITLSN